MNFTKIKHLFSKALILFVVIVITAACIRRDETKIPLLSQGQPGKFEPIAVLELFTSQGCSSCPPADALLGETITAAAKDGLNIFALSFHVDYWNRLGWKDPFSDAAYSARQNKYASKMGLNSAYTPQMIVNGSSEFVGSDRNRLHTELQRELSKKISVKFVKLGTSVKADHNVVVDYALQGLKIESVINFALVSKRETTVIKRGENSGRTLQSENVVMSFITVNALEKNQVNIPVIKDMDSMTLIAFVQNKQNFKITGAAQLELSNF